MGGFLLVQYLINLYSESVMFLHRASTGKKDMGDYLYFWDTKKACAGDWNTVDNPIEV